MKVDRSMKREIMEMVSNAFTEDPMALRIDVAERVMREMESRPDLMERVQEVSLFHMLETITGEYVRRTRSRIKEAIESGQSDTGLDGPPPYEAISKVRLTIPVGGGKFEDKPALACDVSEVRAAKNYYADQKLAMDTRRSYCAALEQAMREEGLDHGEPAARLYAA